MNGRTMSWYQGQSGALYRVLICVLLWMAVLPARASVALLLEEPYGGMGRMNPTGHSAVYFDHICADTPTVLRPCHEGELGAVISRYDGIHGYDWLAMPVLPYLYAVDSPADIPWTADRTVEAKLRDAYRRAHLEGIAPNLPDGGVPGGNWYELTGSAYDRSIYAFQVDTTREQEEDLIALFNDRKNVERYNGAFRNCADFTRVTINRFYPHAIRRNFIADFGLTTPKSVARALTHYAAKHPETHLRIYKIPQITGEIPRSHATRGVTESLLKDYGVPLVLISPVTASVVLAAYIQHGRLSLPKHPELVDFRQPDDMAVSPIPVESGALQDLPRVEAEKGLPADSLLPVEEEMTSQHGQAIGVGPSGSSMIANPFILPGDISMPAVDSGKSH